MEKHDVVIIGGGHNGLIVAAYLAKARVDVCIVELQDIVGGCVATRDLTLPGFKHDVAGSIHMMIQANPLLHQDELGLKSKLSGARESHPRALLSRVEDWRGTQYRPVSSPRLVKPGVRFSRTGLSC